MKCPACSGQLSTVHADPVTIDVCREKCGGLWFDRAELALFDEAHERVAPELLRPVKNSSVVVDHSRERRCPKCASSPLSRRFHDTQYRIEVDECASCGGVWLDLGELENLRTQNKDSADRDRVSREYLARHAGSGPLPKGLAAVFRLLF